MWKLIRRSLDYRQSSRWLFRSLLAILLTTVTAQLEVFSIGLVTYRSVDFFKLFHSTTTTSEVEECVTRDELERTWPLIDREGKGKIRKSEALRYLAYHRKGHFFETLVARMDRALGFSQHTWHLVIFLLVVALLRAIALFLESYSLSLIGIRLAQKIRLDYFNHLQALSLRFYNHYETSALSTRISADVTTLAQALNSLLNNYFRAPLILISSLVALYKLSTPLFSLVFGGIALLFLPTLWLTRRIHRLTHQLQSRQEKFLQMIVEFVAGIETIKSYAMESFSAQRYSHCDDTFVAFAEKNAFYRLLLRPVVHFLGMLLLSAVILWGFYIVKINLSELLVFCGVLYLAYEPIKKFSEEKAKIQDGVVAAERLDEILSVAPDIRDSPHAIELTALRATIEFRDVWFRYDSSQEWILQGFSVSIPSGACVALVGPTGCGKSTLIQLLLRLYEIERGEILIDGHNIRDVTQNSLRSLAAYVPQKPFLFADTIASNIAFGKPLDSTLLEMVSARSLASEFITKFPGGFNYILSEGGSELSGGQQQRLAIARALYRQAPLLILDEATSALDVVTEDRVKRIIQELRHEMTQIVIAHRLSTVEQADSIIYLEKGKALGQGHLEKLLRECPEFSAMWKVNHLGGRPFNA